MRAAFRILLALFLTMNAPSVTSQETAGEPKRVIALQAFVEESTSNHIEEICLAIAKIEGAKVAFSNGAEPHFTISAWNVTPAERDTAIERLQGMAESGPAAITIQCELMSREFTGLESFFLVPDKGSSSELDAFRKTAMQALDLDFEDYKGRSAETWWPHLTLVKLPKDTKSAAKKELEALADIKEIRLTTLAIVEFHEGIRTVATIPLRSQTTSE